LIVDIYRKLCSDVHATAEVDSVDKDEIRMMEGALEAREVKMLVSLLKHFAFPIVVMNPASDSETCSMQ
jgi:hypothetical protein